MNNAGETDWKEGCVVVDLGVLLTSLDIFSVPYPLILLGAWGYMEWMYVAGCT